MKTVVISGAGSGMGLLTAQTLIRAGYAVYAGVRDPHGRSTARRQALEAYASDHGGYVQVVDLDIHQTQSCQDAVDGVVAAHGRLDAVIHNAAHLFIGTAEGFTPEQLADSFNTNAIGAHRLNRAALPHLRRQGDGVLLYVGSTITRIVAPFMMPYVAGKYALDAVAETTAYEVQPLGIETVIVMPGTFMDGTSHFQTAVRPAEPMEQAYAAVQPEVDNYEPGLRRLFRDGQPAPVQAVADEIARVLALPKGAKPLRTTVDFADYGAEAVNAVVEAQTERVFRIMGMQRLRAVTQ
ncbi:SDR family oxidoreductase [Xanthomonas floridensis]|uniref:SDR family oxidoreductase n=1 Tax=Xanthomonas floridensis TaxID=1843580 RepID=A0A1A9M6K1_9XANT|nr:SDR family oxidoreductase [Xanthomonas floridensis]MEA5122907.1 SDR family oxidoreductase [Xanthomonas floridensis]MEA5130677.1 SDR family oxidoreductase [Xanthomonas floridensis]OAG65955.1 short-chain dehydrogenase/reductase [Xanthomonas floridensis]